MTTDSHNRSIVRNLLNQLLITDADYDAFVLDHFPDAQKRFSAQMDRVAKTNILLELNDAGLISESLRKLFPDLIVSCIAGQKSRMNKVAQPTVWVGQLGDGKFVFEKETNKYYFSSLEIAKHFVELISKEDLVNIQRTPHWNQKSEVKLALEARGHFSLYENLCKLENYAIGSRFIIKKLYKVGSESVVYFAHDKSSGLPVICKIPFLDYSRPARFGLKEIEYAREHLIEENQVLVNQSILYFPKPLALEIGPSPLHPPSRASAIRDRELYLFEEFIAGPTLEEETWTWHEKSTSTLEIGNLLLRIAVNVIDFQRKLYDNGRGYYYTDLCPRNIVIDEQNGRVRHVDAGSVILADRGQFSKLRRTTIAYTAPFISPRDRKIIEKHGGTEFSARACLAMLGRSLYFVATNSSPHVGDEIDISLPAFQKLPKTASDFVTALAYGALATFEDAWDILQETTRFQNPTGS